MAAMPAAMYREDTINCKIWLLYLHEGQHQRPQPLQACMQVFVATKSAGIVGAELRHSACFRKGAVLAVGVVVCAVYRPLVLICNDVRKKLLQEVLQHSPSLRQDL